MQGGSEAGGRYRRLELGSALLSPQRRPSEMSESRGGHAMRMTYQVAKQPNAIAGLEALLVESSRSRGGSS